jgi:hypothetical protein
MYMACESRVMMGDGEPAAAEGAQLPVDAWFHVFAFLAPQDLLAVGAVCTEWHALANHNQACSAHSCVPPPLFLYSPMSYLHLCPNVLYFCVQVWRALCEAIQPSSFYPRYAAHLQAAAEDNQENEGSGGGGSYKRAFMARCMRDRLWEGKHYTIEKVSIKSKWGVSVRGVAVSPKVCVASQPRALLSAPLHSLVTESLSPTCSTWPLHTTEQGTGVCSGV